MSNGLRRSKDLIIIIIILLAPIKVLTTEIEVAPLINLDDIAPSYDDLDENLESKDSIDTTSKLNSKELHTSKKATIGILNKITAEVSTVEIEIGQETSIYDLVIFNNACHISCLLYTSPSPRDS